MILINCPAVGFVPAYFFRQFINNRIIFIVLGFGWYDLHMTLDQLGMSNYSTYTLYYITFLIIFRVVFRLTLGLNDKPLLVIFSVSLTCETPVAYGRAQGSWPCLPILCQGTSEQVGYGTRLWSLWSPGEDRFDIRMSAPYLFCAYALVYFGSVLLFVTNYTR